MPITPSARAVAAAAAAALSLLSACAMYSRPASSDAAGPVSPLARTLRSAAARAPLVVAHRGDSGATPENTLVAFEAAVRVGADMIEFDVHATADGELVCLHDSTLDRTTNAADVLGREGVRIDAVRRDELRGLDAGSWFAATHAGARVPTLAEGLEVVQAGSIAMIEHKSGSATAYVAELERLGLTDAVLVQSFDWDWLDEVRSLAPTLTLGLLGSRALDDEARERIARIRPAIVHWHHAKLRVEDIDELHADGYLVCVYTANTDVELLGCVAAGIDLITTNYPGRLASLLDARAAR